MIRSFVILPTLLIGLAGTQLAGETEPKTGEDDAWMGRDRDEIVALLGEPTKEKTRADGEETLLYKLFRVAEDVAPAPGLILIDLPGVGLVARRTEDPDPFAGEELTIDPTGFDDQGRPVAGGFSSSSRGSITWNEQYKVERQPDVPKEPETLGKIKLTFQLDRNGAVVGWSVSPKKQARP